MATAAGNVSPMKRTVEYFRVCSVVSMCPGRRVYFAKQVFAGCFIEVVSNSLGGVFDAVQHETAKGVLDFMANRHVRVRSNEVSDLDRIPDTRLAHLSSLEIACRRIALARAFWFFRDLLLLSFVPSQHRTVAR